MTNEQLLRLKELAEKAKLVMQKEEYQNEPSFIILARNAVVNFLYAVTPEIMLALINRIEELEEADNPQALTTLGMIYSDREKDLKKRIKELEKEADWLARRLAEFCDPEHDDQCCPFRWVTCNSVDYQNWRKAAREAVEVKQNDIG